MIYCALFTDRINLFYFILFKSVFFIVDTFPFSFLLQEPSPELEFVKGYVRVGGFFCYRNVTNVLFSLFFQGPAPGLGIPLQKGRLKACVVLILWILSGNATDILFLLFLGTVKLLTRAKHYIQLVFRKRFGQIESIRI